MLPGHTRLFFCGFAVVACAVTVNALRQPSRATAVIASVAPPVASKAKPAEPPPVKLETAAKAPVANVPPSLSLATVGEPVRAPARLPSAPVVGQAHLPNVLDGDADVIRALQKELVNGGYGPLAVNGNAGHLTRAAIMGYEHDHGMPLTGEASERLLKRIRSGEAPRKSDDATSRRIATQDAEQVVLIVQTSLEALGHNPGRIDGRMGDDTIAAIRAFEADAKMKSVGRISADLFSQLARSVGAKSANR